jgi:hypothetical protein
MQHHVATPAKLRDGSWGARIVGADQAPKAGETCTIRAASGKTWDASITRVVWSGKDTKTGEPVALCATASTEPRPRRDPVARQAAAATRAMGRRACRECGGEIQSWCRGSLCHDCE